MELKDVLHFYIGCKIDISINGTVLNADWYDRIINDECDGKPILRPLSDMTEEEKSLLVDPMCYGLNTLQGDELIKQAAILTYELVKQGFDVFDLIESGQAINKTKLNP